MSTNTAAIKSYINSPASGSSVYGRDFSQLCQALIWRLIDKFGSPTAPTVFGSAEAARRASGTLNKVSSAAPAGAFHYWELGANGHVALDLEGGGTHVLMGTSRKPDGSTSWGNGIRVATVAAYTATGAKYLGWSTRNGTSTIPVTPTAVALLSTQRKVKSTAAVNRRTGPGTNYPTAGKDLPVNEIGNFIGWAYGQDDQPKRVWFKGVSNNWFVSTGFTSASTSGLADLNREFVKPPVVTPPVVVDPPVVPPIDPPVVVQPPVVTPPATVDPEPEPPVVTPPAVEPVPPASSSKGLVVTIVAFVALVGGFIAANWPW